MICISTGARAEVLLCVVFVLLQQLVFLSLLLQMYSYGVRQFMRMARLIYVQLCVCRASVASACSASGAVLIIIIVDRPVPRTVLAGSM